MSKKFSSMLAATAGLSACFLLANPALAHHRYEHGNSHHYKYHHDKHHHKHHKHHDHGDCEREVVVVRPAPVYVAPAPVVYQAPSYYSNYCRHCGTVQSVYRVNVGSSGLGAVTGAVVGGILGNQVGGGDGRTLATVAGAVTGGVIGDSLERRNGTQTMYEVKIRAEDGVLHTARYPQAPGWRSGERVWLNNGVWVRR